MTSSDKLIKRIFDISFSFFGLILLWPIILVTAFLAARDTGASGFFVQKRVGRDGKLFSVVKLRTMRPVSGTTVTCASDARITPLGAKFRQWKLDELPQLWNVLKGEMSFVGPRPDVPGYLDKLEGDDAQSILELRPGITGPATLAYRNEEELLANVDNPEKYNRNVIWPEKVRINLEYAHSWSFRKDIKYILETIFR